MARLRGDTWQGDVTYKGQRHRQDGFATEEEATIWEVRTRAALKNGAALPAATPAVLGRAPRATLKDGVTKTAARFWSGKAAERHAMTNAQAALDFFGVNKPMAEITRAEIEKYVAHLKGTTDNSDATINRKLAALCKVLNHAATIELIDAAPSFKGIRFAELENRHREVTAEEEALILQTFKQWSLTDAHDFTVFLIDVGCRLGEALKLVDSRVRLKEGLVVFTADTTKNKRTRGVPMSARVQAMMERRLGTGRPFGSLSQRQYRHAWERMKAHLKLTKDDAFVPHCLRHTCASRLVQSYVDLYTVQQWLGHTTSKMTQRYAHLAPQHLIVGREAIDRFNKGEAAVPRLVAVK